MDFLAVLIVGVAIGVFVAGALAPRGGVKQRPAPQSAPDPPDTTDDEDESGDRLYRDVFVNRLYALQHAVTQIQQPSIPDEMLEIEPFRGLVETLSGSEVNNATRLNYVHGRDAILAWAAMVALERQPKDVAVEERLFKIINAFNAWTRHFVLRVFEAWNPEDPRLVARVLALINESWDEIDNGVVLNGFLRRRSTVAPLTLGGWRPGSAIQKRTLRRVLRHHADPDVARGLLEEVFDGRWPPPEEMDGAPGPGTPQPEQASQPWGVSSLHDIGRVHEPKTLKDDHLLGWPSADVQLDRMLGALRGSPPRSVLIVGDPGVGKSSLVRRAAARLSREDWTVLEAGATQIAAGTIYIGSLESRLKQALELLEIEEQTLWVVPDFHQLLWSGRHTQSPTGVLEMLIPAIESGSVLMLGETRPATLERVLNERPEVARLFEIVRLEAPSDQETLAILDAWAHGMASRKQVEVPAEIRAEGAALARQFLLTQPPPGGVMRLLGGALARARREHPQSDGRATVTVDDLVVSLADLTGLPLDLLDERRGLDLEAVRNYFESRVIGQTEAVRCLVDRLALFKAGVADPDRPVGVFLFAGGSGTGKTELARTLAEYLFGSPDRVLRLDMSELQDASALDRLLGAGDRFGSGGNSLAERVRRQPFCVVLLDEFERAYPRVWDIFLPVFDAGRLTDQRGETTDFRHAIIILTSNLGTESWGQARLGLVEDWVGSGSAAIERAVRRTFRPELLNRLDRVIVFRPLTRDVMRRILQKELADAFARRGLRRRGWAVELEESAIDLLVERGFSPTLGARPLKRALEHLLLTPLAAAIVNRSAPEGDQFLFVRADGRDLAVEFVDPDASVSTTPAAAAVGAAPPGPGDLASIIFEGLGGADEIEVLRATLDELGHCLSSEQWKSTKAGLLLEASGPDFWSRPDRFERLGRAEYMDRIENAHRSATSVLGRLLGDPRMPRVGGPREIVRRLAQQLYLVKAAFEEALDTGPRDAFVSVEIASEDPGTPGAARDFARRVADMYGAWARLRGMRLADLQSDGADEAPRALAIAGFAAYRLLEPENGLHVLEWDEPGTRVHRRATVRVRVRPQPSEPADDGIDGLRRQADAVLGAPGPLTTKIVRRYREQPSPLVKDSVRGWRTGRIERVLKGDFDVIPVRD